MQCPACGNELLPKAINNTTYHICDGGCGGVWFDWREMEHWDENPDYSDAPLIIKTENSQSLNQSKRYTCPSCENIIMKRRYLDTIEDILADECPSCSGFWLNGDELEEMHNQMDTPNAQSEDGLDAKGLKTQNREKRLIAACHGLCPNQLVG